MTTGRSGLIGVRRGPGGYGLGNTMFACKAAVISAISNTKGGNRTPRIRICDRHILVQKRTQATIMASIPGALRESSGSTLGRIREVPGVDAELLPEYSKRTPGLASGSTLGRIRDIPGVDSGLLPEYVWSIPGVIPGPLRERPGYVPECSRSTPVVLREYSPWLSPAYVFVPTMCRSQIRIGGVRFSPFGFDIAEMTAISLANIVFQGLTRRHPAVPRLVPIGHW